MNQHTNSTESKSGFTRFGFGIVAVAAIIAAGAIFGPRLIDNGSPDEQPAAQVDQAQGDQAQDQQPNSALAAND